MRRACCNAALLALVAGTALSAPWNARADEAARPPAQVHLEARYRGTDGAWHRLSMWRDGERFLHRRTDARVDLFVTADAEAAGGYRYRLLDHRARALVEIDRSNLLRIGVFADWRTLAHVVAPPSEQMQVGSADASLGAGPTGLPCTWYRSTSPANTGTGVSTEVCWSAKWAAPVRIRVASGAAGVGGGAAEPDRFELLVAEAANPQAAEMRLPALAAGYDLIDANADIDPAGD